MNLIDVNTLSVILILIGVVLMLFGIINTLRIIRFLEKNKHWKTLLLLMMFFLFGYLLFIICLLLNISIFGNLLVGFVFLFGALFVLLVVKISLRTVKDILKVEKLTTLSVTDPLTGLYNRRYMNQMIKGEIERAVRYKRLFSLLMIDIDFFKQINDSFGHIYGDNVLKKMGRLLTKIFRTTDIISRYGGEEFVILLPETSKEKAFIAIERVRMSVEAFKFPFTKFIRKSKEGLYQNVHDTHITITISGGVIDFSGEKTTSVEKLIKEVDSVLYKAKESGRNRVLALNLNV